MITLRRTIRQRGFWFTGSRNRQTCRIARRHRDSLVVERNRWEIGGASEGSLQTPDGREEKGNIKSGLVEDKRKWGRCGPPGRFSVLSASGCRTPIDSRLRSTPVIVAAGDPLQWLCSIAPTCPGPRRKRKSTQSSITSVCTRHKADSCCRCKRTSPIGSIKRWVSSCLILYCEISKGSKGRQGGTGTCKLAGLRYVGIAGW